MKSDLQKGGLYLIDEAFRERCRAWGTAAATSQGMAIWVEVKAMAMGMEIGTKYISNWQPYDNGIVLLLDVENHGNTDKSWDICKVVFNNKSGIRYLYRDALELAERLDK